MSANPVIKRGLLEIIKFPILTKKTRELIKQNKYSFAVDTNATKQDIKLAIEELFETKLISVNTSLSPQRKRRVGRFIGPVVRYKKAIVEVTGENSISFLKE